MTIIRSAGCAVGTETVTLWSVIIRHIFGGASRKLSEKYGLVVYLCGSRCHRNGKYAVHRNAETAQALHEYGQRKYMSDNGATIADFRKIFGRNYLDTGNDTADS